MGCIISGEADQSAINSNIEKQIEKDKQEVSRTIKLLLLGGGECGKSTVLKQMRILHSNGFAEPEFQIQKSIIHENIMTSIVSIITAMQRLQIGLENGNLQEDVSYVLLTNNSTKKNIASYNWQFLDAELVGSIRRLWQDSGVQQCFARGSEFQLLDSAKYFLDDIERIGKPDYCPTQADILHSRSKTVNIIDVAFEIKGKKFQVFDVGGQRSCRRKWIHCFDNVRAIIFMAAISEYDMMLREEDSMNRIIDSLLLFESICGTRWFSKTNIILFLNKKDLFANKIKEKPISIAFPEYCGPQTYEDSLKFISLKFGAQNREPSRLIYEHVTCATDTNQMELVLDSVVHTVIQGNLTKMGLFEQ